MDDLIRRQDAIDVINALHEKQNAWLDCAVDAVMTLPSAQQWIPCSERLPEKNGRYWVWCEILIVPDHVDDPCSYYGSREASCLDGRWYGDSIGKVVAWMPLPEPYKESEDKE